MNYSAQNYEDVFDNFHPSDASEINGEVRAYRTMTIRSGDVLEVKAYPIWSTASMVRKAKKHRCKEKSDQYNNENRIRKMIRKVNANFTEHDLFLTVTYDDDSYVPDEKTARKDRDIFLRRIKRYRKTHGMSDLKYFSVIEFGSGDRRRKRVHHHFIISGMDRDEAERLWDKGRCNASRLKPDEYGVERLVRYMLKETGKRKSMDNRSCTYSCSRNLVEPKVQYSDKKLSRRRAARMAEDCTIKAGAIFTKLFPGYRFVDCTVKTSSFVSGAYITAQMIKEKDDKSIHTKRSRRTDHALKMGRVCQEHPSGVESSVPHPKRRKKE